MHINHHDLTLKISIVNMDHCASIDTKYFRTELSQKRRLLLKMIDSIVDQTRENHLPVERELSTVDSMNLKL